MTSGVDVLLSGAVVLAVYLLTLAPTVTSEDSGELITAAYGFGIAHPPGYPLWCLVAGCFASLAPAGAVAYAVNLSSALFGAATAAVCSATLLLLGTRRWAAFLAGVCLGVSKELWAQSVIAEVYSLNLFCVAVLTLVLLVWERFRDHRLLVLFSGLLGVAMGNHHTVLAVGAVGLVWVIALAPRLVLNARLVVGVSMAFLLGLAIYAYLPLQAAGNPYLNWGDPESPESFWSHVSRAQYPSDWDKPHSLVRTVGQFGVVAGSCLEQFTPLLAFPILLGLWISRRRPSLAYAAGFTLLSNFEFQRENLHIIRVFYLPSYYVLALWLGFGLDHLLTTAARWRPDLNERRVNWDRQTGLVYTFSQCIT